MIGIIENKLVFEFRDDKDLDQALNDYCNQQGGLSNPTIFIVDTSDNIKIIIDKTGLKMSSIKPEQKYYLYGCNSAALGSNNDSGYPAALRLIWSYSI